MSDSMNPSPKIGLALGSGAARGLAHIGVLRQLDTEGVPIHCIAGTSIGALIGVLYAAGLSPETLAQVASELHWKRLARLLDPVLPTSGLIDGNKVRRFIQELLPVDHFHELQIPVAITATDIYSGEPLIIRQGKLLDALQAALAFPGIFNPVRIGQRFAMDGGLCNPVPTDVAHELGAKHVIGVCAIPQVQPPQETYIDPPDPHKHQTDGQFFSAQRIERLFRDILNKRDGDAHGPKAPSLLRVGTRSIAIMENQINDLRLELHPPDILLRPKLHGITLLEFHRAKECIQAGEDAVKANRHALQQLCQPGECGADATPLQIP